MNVNTVTKRLTIQVHYVPMCSLIQKTDHLFVIMTLVERPSIIQGL
jgi:hypothetical protein